MRRWISALLFPLFSAAALAGTPLPDAPHVVLQGEGLVSVAPDSATVTMPARHRSGDAVEAKRAVDRAVEALLQAAPRFELEAEDLTASDISPREQIDYDDDVGRRPPAYIASREVKARLNDLERLGAGKDAALATGFTDIADISIKSSREAALREEARALAVAEAKEKASGLVVAFGGGLGPVYSINNLNSQQAHGYGNSTLDRIMVTGSRMDSGRYLQPQIELTERVSAVFEFTP